MEILSDATFRGATTFKKDVTISGADFFITRDDNTSLFYVVRDASESDTVSEIVHIDGSAHITCNMMVGGGVFVSKGVSISKSLTLNDFHCIYVGSPGESWPIVFPSKSGTLALTSQIPTVPSVKGFLKYKKVPINFNVPADCTVFTTAMDTGVQSDKVVSLNLFKGESITFGSTTCWATKQVPADVWAIVGGQYFVVEKSSAFAISSSDGYEIRAAYYE